jgi:hypothetical protein
MLNSMATDDQFADYAMINGEQKYPSPLDPTASIPPLIGCHVPDYEK